MRLLHRRTATTGGIAGIALTTLTAPAAAAPQTFAVPCGDVAALRTAITAANGTPDTDTIVLGPGDPCTYTLANAATTSTAAGGNVTGLPVVLQPLKIDGNGATIERSAASGTPDFRLIATLADLELHELALLRGRLAGATQSGGALAAVGADLVLDRTTVLGNVVTGGSATGGGLAVAGGSLTVDRSSLAFNQATAGGAMSLNQVGGILRRSLVYANRGTAQTGGALVLGSYAFESSTFTANHSENGTGGITVAPSGTVPGHAEVVSSTFADNGRTGSTAPGAALAAVAFGGPATIAVTDSIVTDTNSTATPTQPACLEVFTGAEVVDEGGNVEHPGTTCGFDTNEDPGIEPLASNGGPTATHRLRPDSPALDLGGEDCPETDQRLEPRPEGEACDAGAYEANPPQTTAVGPAQSPTDDPVVTFSADEAPATFECRVDGGAWQSCTSPYRPALDDGSHTVDVRATDGDGYVDATPASVTFVVDRAPQTTITGGPTGTIDADSATFSFTSDDPDATFECRMDGGAWSACTSPRTYGGLAPGSHTFSVRAVDQAGQRDPTPASRTFNVRRCFIRIGQIICL